MFLNFWLVMGLMSLLGLIHAIGTIRKREVVFKNALHIEAYYGELKGIYALRFGIVSAIGQAMIAIAGIVLNPFYKLFPQNLFIATIILGILFLVAAIFLATRYGKRNPAAR